MLHHRCFVPPLCIPLSLRLLLISFARGGSGDEDLEFLTVYYGQWLNVATT